MAVSIPSELAKQSIWLLTLDFAADSSRFS